MQKTINELCHEAHQNSINKGWYEEPRSFGDLISLIHSEVSEVLEEYRNGFRPKQTYFENPNQTAVSDVYTPLKPCGIPIELADVVIRIFDMCGYYGIDLEEAIRLKMDYNKSRPHRHGGKKL